MSSFFDSEIIKEELEEINELQQEVYGDAFNLMRMSSAERVEHVENLETLLEKQKIMYTRVSLSDDPQAVEMKKNLEKSVKLMGFPTGTDMSQLFDAMDKTIEKLKQSIVDI
jgi:hypothetical protein